ncbi:RNA-directed RNA polymerase [Ranunculus cassubicifolius]
MGKTIRISGFPYYVSAIDATKFLENYSGKDTVIALRIKVKDKKSNVTVEFTDSEKTRIVYSRINDKGLKYYDECELKAWEVENDVLGTKKEVVLSVEASALHFGCQTSNEGFVSFEDVADVKVNFGLHRRKIDLLFSYCDVEYRLRLSYDSISRIDERRPWNGCSRFLVIQMLAAPRIYERCTPGAVCAFSNYSKHASDDDWIRTTDFTATLCVGQSSALCVEIEQSCLLHCISECFHQYKENISVFYLEHSSKYSANLVLGPTVSPPHGLELPFDIMFKVNSLIQHGRLSGPTLDEAFFRLIHPQYHPLNIIESALEKLKHMKECCYEPVRWLREQYEAFNTIKQPQRPPISLDDGLVYIRRVLVTPTRVYFCGPEVNVSNRVLRNFGNYIDNFIRVSFVDEDGKKISSTDLTPRGPKQYTSLYERIISTLKNGIVIYKKKFEFLAFSSSQVRKNSTWMFAAQDGVTARSIRRWMGDFQDIRNVAKYAARLGQSFGSSREASIISRHDIEIIPDIKVEWNGDTYVFSDGIGKISAEFARRVAEKCGVIGRAPSAFQIRYAGYKGVVAVDPNSVKTLSLRRSMCKYTSAHVKLDVLAWSRYQPCFLNRQVITLLSTLGISDDVFRKKQREMINRLDMILSDGCKAYETIDVMAPQESADILKIMLLCGYKPGVEPFLSLMLQTIRRLKLLELRNKARIFVPQGRLMMGCLDETGTLEYGEVFVQVSRLDRESVDISVPFTIVENEPDPCTFVCEGKLVVAKNPCLYPGDLRVLKAVNVPALQHMVDCVVFPQKGHRPHPNECSGSDLDGDVYFVSWDPELIPPREIPPMDYSSVSSVVLEHDVRIEEVQDYFANYMINDSLGIIANAHTVFADKEPEMAESQVCCELAKLFSIAVDYPKTGVPAIIPPHLYASEYPDFMEKFDKPIYESQRVLGKLYREVSIPPEIDWVRSSNLEVVLRLYDPDIRVDGFEDFLEEAQYLKGEYDFKLETLMHSYGIESEAEVFCGSIMKLKKSLNNNQDAETVGLAIGSLKNEVRSWFYNKKSGTQDDVCAKASAWYHVTYHPSYWVCYDGAKRNHFLSFPWCVCNVLIHIKMRSTKCPTTS